MEPTTTHRLRVGACLSLSGRFARFGQQSAQGLDMWRALEDEPIDLIIEDDHSDPHTLAAALPDLLAACDLVLGPYSTQLMRTAGRIAAETDRLIWNHGGAGDDVQAAHPGHIVSVLAPTSRYAEPFLRILFGGDPAWLWIVHGQGGFGEQVAFGAAWTAVGLGIMTTLSGPSRELPRLEVSTNWHLLCAGTFEEDIQTVERAQLLPKKPRSMCAVAAGVSEFGNAVSSPDGIYGVGQWSPASEHSAELGPTKDDFVTAYTERYGKRPDYPAAQAAAGAVLATHCARAAGDTSREALWSAATALDTETLFGGFKIDPVTGVQIKHTPVLVRWTSHGLALV